MSSSVGHFNEIRKYSKTKLLEFLQSHNDISIDKALALFSLQNGLKVSTLKIYVYELREAELIE